LLGREMNDDTWLVLCHEIGHLRDVAIAERGHSEGRRRLGGAGSVTGEQRDLGTACAQLGRERAADETAASGDEIPHQFT
jgi:hypothetical protein